MNETVVSFGDGGNLSGILALPDQHPSGAPAAILLNSGMIHRVGACRVPVKLARLLAEGGTPTFRFDFSGTGDSGPRVSGMELEEGHRLEARLAMDFLAEKYSCERFVLYGLCSGARDAFSVALEDERVLGIVQIDGFAYRTSRYHLAHYLNRAMDPGAWAGFLRKAVGMGMGEDSLPSGGGGGQTMVVEMWPDYPPRDEVEEGYGRLVARGVKMHVLFTGSWDDQYNYRNQFYHMYPRVNFDGLLTLRFMPDAEHVLPQPDVQKDVLEGIGAWIKSEF